MHVFNDLIVLFFHLTLFRGPLTRPRHNPTNNSNNVFASYNWNTNNHNFSADYWNHDYCKNNRHNTYTNGNNNSSCLILHWNNKSVQKLYVSVSLLWTVICMYAILDSRRILWLFFSLCLQQSLSPHHSWKQPWQKVPRQLNTQQFYPPQQVLH